MDTLTTATTAISRKNMRPEEFLDICKGKADEKKWGVEIYNGTVSLNKTKWKNEVKVEEHYSGKVIVFSNIEVLDNIQIINESDKLPCLIFDNCTFSGIHIEKSSIHSLYVINNSEIERIRIIENSELGYILFKKVNVGALNLQNSTATILRIEKHSVINKIKIWHSQIQRVRIAEGSIVNHIFCQFSHKTPTQFLADSSYIGYLDFNDSTCPAFTTYNLTACKIHTISFGNFCNYGSISFSALAPWDDWDQHNVLRRGEVIRLNTSPTLQFTDSDLGKMQFISCDLNLYNYFVYYNTKMLSVFVAGSKMPVDTNFYLPQELELIEAIEKEQLRANHNDIIIRNLKKRLEELSKKKPEQKRLANGQFKKIYETQGDIAGSLRYLSFEMEAYRTQLKEEKSSKRFSKEWNQKRHWDNRGERATLWLNKFSTNYGNNWLRGAILTMGMVCFCYTVFCWMRGYWFGNDWVLFGKLVSYAPYYLNPLRDLDSIPMIDENHKTPIEWYARLWDSISRIIIAYFVYQTIQAFRKLGKSSG